MWVLSLVSHVGGEGGGEKEPIIPEPKGEPFCGV